MRHFYLITTILTIFNKFKFYLQILFSLLLFVFGNHIPSHYHKLKFYPEEVKHSKSRDLEVTSWLQIEPFTQAPLLFHTLNLL